MKCDVCGKRDAVFHMQEQSAIGRRRINLCFECALAKGLNIPEEDVDKLFSSFISNIFADGQIPATDIASQAAAKILNLKCPECGKTVEDITEANEAGCIKCFSYFGALIDAILVNMNNSLDYRGDFPAELRLEHDYKVEIFNLQNQLEQCISTEDFGKAAEIRDKIKALQSNECLEEEIEEE